jgi:hypothetical protein
MKKIIRSRNILLGTVFAAAIAGLGGGQNVFSSGSAQAQGMGEGDVMVPKFEVDPLWPKPLPNGWVIGQTIGLSTDSRDNIWIIHRPGSLEQKESYGTRKEADCCTAAPDVLEFDQAGNLLHHWGKVAGHDWPTSNHGITVDAQGNVWLGANGAGQPSPNAPGSAAQFAAARGARAPAPALAPASGATAGAEAGGGSLCVQGKYHDSFMLKFTQDGKFLGEIGRANGSRGSLDKDNVCGVATIRFIPGTNELVAADGYGNHRVSVWDPVTMKLKRMWGANGKPPTDKAVPHYDPNSPQFGNPVHCAQPSNDGLIYVCDRTNDRLQVFKTDGTFVKQYPIETNTRGDGSVWEIAFSRDPQQKFMYISDGSNEKIHVFDRQSMKELYWFGGGGRQPGHIYAVHSIVTDSKGNIFTTETYRGQRVQKFIYKGMVPLSSLIKQHVVGGSVVGQ